MFGSTLALADWWDRPEVRPTQPSEDHRQLPTIPPEPTQPPQLPTPTVVPIIATATPRVGDISSVPIPTPTPSVSGGSGSGTTSENPCDPGKPFTGSYCGWSPGVSSGSVAAKDGGVSTTARIGGPAYIRGLSKTSSDDLAPSDIILLTGALCLLLYVRSKINVRKWS